MRALICLTLFAFAFVFVSAEMCFFAPNGSTICSLADVCSHREKVPEDKRVYTTVASENYFLGAVVLAQSLLDVNAKADIVIAVPIVNNSAVDAWVPHAKDLVASMKNKRVSVRTYYANPIPDFLPEKTKKNPKTVYWYGKLNLWGVLHDYKKAQFIDSDAVAMDNMDLFFEFPELTFSACPRTPINSGWFVFKPSMKTMNEMVGMEFEGNFSAINGWRGVGPHFPWTAAKPFSLTDNRKNRQNLKTSCFIRELKDKAGCSWEWGPTEQGIIYHQFYYEKKSVCPFPFPPSNGKDVPYYYHYNDVFCQSLATSDLKPWQITPDHKCWPKAFDPWQVAFEHLAASVGSTTAKLREVWVK